LPALHDCLQTGLLSLLYKHANELDLCNQLIKYHYIIHEQIIIGKVLGFKLIVTDVISAFKLYSVTMAEPQTVQAFLDVIKRECSVIVYYTEVHWYIKGKLLQHFRSLLEEIKVFVIEKEQEVSHFEDVSCLCDLVFLTCICGYLKCVNIRLQEKC
jgi:hypothetical protein